VLIIHTVCPFVCHLIVCSWLAVFVQFTNIQVVGPVCAINNLQVVGFVCAI